MNEDFPVKSFQLEDVLSLEEIRRQMAGCKDIPGVIAVIGDQGARFIPDDPAFPATYFAEDGHTLEVVVKDLDLSDTEDYLCRLARALGTRILSEHLEYY
jgi:hypothetical protein